jgi:hypothetical protein
VRRVLITLLTSIFWFGIVQSSFEKMPDRDKPDHKHYAAFEQYALTFYSQLDDTSLNFTAFKTALRGYYFLKEEGKLKNTKVLTLIDYSKSANTKRFFVIDQEQQKILFKTYVAHGKGSGVEYPTSFSNNNKSHKSSLGFFVTGQTYYGRHGYSLRLMGIENNFNSNALKRAIVIHGAGYVSKEYILHNGRLGRSFGCPALPTNVNKNIIDTIKNSSCLFCYYPEKEYFATSSILHKMNDGKITGSIF